MLNQSALLSRWIHRAVVFEGFISTHAACVPESVQSADQCSGCLPLGLGASAFEDRPSQWDRGKVNEISNAKESQRKEKRDMIQGGPLTQSSVSPSGDAPYIFDLISMWLAARQDCDRGTDRPRSSSLRTWHSQWHSQTGKRICSRWIKENDCEAQTFH